MQKCTVCEAPLKVVMLLPRCNQGEMVSTFGASMVKLCTENIEHGISVGALRLMLTTFDMVDHLDIRVAHDRAPGQ